MTMKWIRAAVMACGLVLLAGPAAAQEMTFRSGVITGITPMQVEAAAAPQTASRSAGAFGRALGRVAGRAAARVTGEYTYEAYEVANSATNDLVSAATAAPAAGARTVTAYMVMLRFARVASRRSVPRVSTTCVLAPGPGCSVAVRMRRSSPNNA